MTQGPRALVTVATVQNLATAQVMSATLGAAGIEAFVPDEHTASMFWMWSQAIGGIRVQVEAPNADAARAALADLAEGGTAAAEAEVPAAPGDEPAALSAAESLALRAYRGSLVGFFLWPVLHPITLAQALLALSRGAARSRRGRTWAGLALVFSLLSMAMVVAMVATMVAAYLRP